MGFVFINAWIIHQMGKMQEMFEMKDEDEYFGDDSNFPSEFDEELYLLIGK